MIIQIRDLHCLLRLVFIHSLPYVFSFAIESYIYDADFTLSKKTPGGGGGGRVDVP